MGKDDSLRIFKNNLRMQMALHGKTRQDICDDLGIRYTTFANWFNGEKYPRIDKIELLANYFGISKAELIEDNDTIMDLSKIDPAFKMSKDLLSQEEKPAAGSGELSGEKLEWSTAWDNATPEARQAALSVLRLGARRHEDQGSTP